MYKSLYHKHRPEYKGVTAAYLPPETLAVTNTPRARHYVVLNRVRVLSALMSLNCSVSLTCGFHSHILSPAPRGLFKLTPRHPLLVDCSCVAPEWIWGLLHPLGLLEFVNSSCCFHHPCLGSVRWLPYPCLRYSWLLIHHFHGRPGERRLQGCLIAAFQHQSRDYERAVEGIFTRVWSDRTRGNGS